MKRSKENDQEHCLEESTKYVRRRESQRNNPEYCRQRPLRNRVAESVQCIAHALVAGVALCRHVSVRNMRREIDTETDAHDDVDH